MIRSTMIVLLTLAALGTLVLWLASPSDFVYSLKVSQATLRLGTVEGRLIFLYGVFLEEEPPGIQDIYGWESKLFGFNFLRLKSLPNPPLYVDGWRLRIPFPYPIVLFLLYPVIALVRGPMRRWRRRRMGLCVKCAYNLTGNVSGTCPECGTEIKKP